MTKRKTTRKLSTGNISDKAIRDAAATILEGIYKGDSCVPKGIGKSLRTRAYRLLMFESLICRLPEGGYRLHSTAHGRIQKHGCVVYVPTAEP